VSSIYVIFNNLKETTVSKLKYLACLAVIFTLPAFAVDSRPSDASIRQLLAITQARKLVDGIMAQMDGMMKNTMQQAMHGHPVTPDQQKIIDGMQARTVALLRQELSWDNMEPMYIGLYSGIFTQEEVDGMLAFYKTPSGQAVIRKMPVLMQNTMAEVQKRMVPLMQKMQALEQETLAELKASQERPGDKHGGK
jgi:hypothetical protein